MSDETRHFLIRWQAEFGDGRRVRLDASEGTHVDGVQKGDVLWIQIVNDDCCYLIGRIVVGWCRPAKGDREAIVRAKDGTVRYLQQIDITDLLPTLRFVSKTATRIDNEKDLHWSLFNRRRLTPESATRLAIVLDERSQPWLEHDVQRESRPTLFSFGYWGWGRKTEHLVRMVDEHEAACGYERPLWIDIRWRRSGRAPGFVDDAFEKTVGSDRYLWLKDLGNEAIEDDRPGSIRINRPSSAVHLLSLGMALQQACPPRRVIFFCSCRFPHAKDKATCHRVTVTRLLLNQASRIGQPIEVVEWPGGHTGIAIAPRC